MGTAAHTNDPGRVTGEVVTQVVMKFSSPLHVPLGVLAHSNGLLSGLFQWFGEQKAASDSFQWLLPMAFWVANSNDLGSKKRPVAHSNG